jgi:hypothetical protein
MMKVLEPSEEAEIVHLGMRGRNFNLELLLFGLLKGVPSYSLPALLGLQMSDYPCLQGHLGPDYQKSPG